jgi:hypothetical protein
MSAAADRSPPLSKLTTEKAQEISRMQVTTILNRYRFETRGYNSQELLETWLPEYSLDWIRMAVLEALYRGRYKTISVEEILKSWQRRGRPTYNFTPDFERLVCKNLPGNPAPGSGEPPRSTGRRRERGEALPPSPGPLENSIFDDPRKGMSDVGELLSGRAARGGRENGDGPDAKEGTSGNSIQEFIPRGDGSRLYSRLIAVARSGVNDRPSLAGRFNG